MVDESSIGVSTPSAAIGSLSGAPPVNEDGGDAEAATPVVVVEELPEETPVRVHLKSIFSSLLDVFLYRV